MTVLFSPKLEPVSPELLFVEIEKHLEEVKNKSRLAPDDVEKLFFLLKKKVQVFPMEE